MSPPCALEAIYIPTSPQILLLKSLIAMENKNWNSIMNILSSLCWKLPSLSSNNQITLLQQMQAIALEMLKKVGDDEKLTNTIAIIIAKVISEVVHSALTSNQRDV
jgi:hypothetical protein